MGNRTTRSPHPSSNTTKADGHLLEYFRQNFGGGGGANSGPTEAPLFGPPNGLSATGGIISDYSDPGTGNVYRSHIFTASGSFVVTGTGDYPAVVDCLVVGGGGGGGYQPSYGASGGGGGGVHYKTGLPVSAGPTTYPITIGAGGSPGANGGSTSSPLAPGRTALGGGGGATSDGGSGSPGASSGGGNYPDGGSAGNELGATGHPGGIDIESPAPNANGWGNVAAQPNPSGSGGDGSGGGGAGGAGSQQSTSSPANPGDGGPGVRYSTAYGPDNLVSYGGGGTGGLHNGPNPDISPLDARPAALRGGGGAGGPNPGDASATGLPGGAGESGTGGGGGGAGNKLPSSTGGGQGGSGTFIIRYQIGRVAAEAKATGGAISFYNDKVIHTFTNSGALVVPATISDVEYVVIGGGGGGNSSIGGGGGSGAVLYSNGSPETISLPAATYPVVIGAGGRTGQPGSDQAGGDTTWNSYVAGGGGGGQRNSPDTNTQGRPSTVPSGSAVGAGGGGGCGNSNEAGATGGSPGGYSGGNGNDPTLGSGGGGGSGGAGGNAPSNTGGVGTQLPTTFRDPESSIGFPGSSGTYWIAGGGGGGARGSPTQSQNGGFGAGGSSAVGGETPTQAGWSYAGAGNGVGNNHPGKRGGDAAANSGSGGGGGRDSSSPSNGGAGGSGVVLIAYPVS